DFNFSRLIPDALRCAVTGKKLYIRSDGKFVRDYVYVKDIARAYIILAERMLQRRLRGEAFNFSDENPMTVLAVVKKIYAAANARPNYAVLNKAKYEIKEQFLSSEKARRLLGWKPRYSFDEALEETVDWYRTQFGRSR
ncbi:MAG: GDP-mannose 4,6-dehydratase, partial [Candidatus Omnitrophica bacterium]|nr:GDP-mannose 4,6-dehydratase [Candidatus Omnitrophota bacterium]